MQSFLLLLLVRGTERRGEMDGILVREGGVFSPFYTGKTLHRIILNMTALSIAKS